MASIPTLFNLDPTQFALGRNTGRFKQLVGAPTTQNPAELGNLLQGITGITADRPEDFSLEKPVPQYTGQSLIDKALSLLDTSNVRINSIANFDASGVRANASGYIKNLVEGNPVTINSFMNAEGAQNVIYNRAVAALQSAQAPYKADIDAYNTALQSYKTKAETYAADVNRYLGEQETARNKFQSEYLGQDVEDPNILASGDVLAASSLYSDQLHQQMIERIAEANADVMPGSDQVTSLYS